MVDRLDGINDKLGQMLRFMRPHSNQIGAFFTNVPTTDRVVSQTTFRLDFSGYITNFGVNRNGSTALRKGEQYIAIGLQDTLNTHIYDEVLSDYIYESHYPSRAGRWLVKRDDTLFVNIWSVVAQGIYVYARGETDS